MGETYCGKSCETCIHKESLSCPGCKAGPGKLLSGECSLASCCRAKGHEACDTCCLSTSCRTLHGRESIPEYRLERRAAEAERTAQLTRRAPFLGKWLWILFWLIIPNILAGFMTNKTIATQLPALRQPGRILSILCSAAYGIILLKLSSEETHYRTAGICGLICAAVAALTVCLSDSGEAAWSLVLTISGAVVSLIGEYHEFIGHAEILDGADPELPEKWTRLWKWYIGMFAAILGSIIVMLIVPILGMLVLLAAAIGILAVGILKLVYLYRTAALFRAYAEAE